MFNYGYLNMCNAYGIDPLTVDEEIALPAAKKKTRANKMLIVDDIGNMKKMLDNIEWRAKSAPELDDDYHAELVQKFRDAVADAYCYIIRANEIGNR